MAGPGGRLAARHFVDAVIHDDHVDVRRMVGERHQTAEIHEHRPVAVQDDDPALRLRERQAQTQGRSLTHGRRHVGEVERRVGEPRPDSDRRHGRDDDALAAVLCQNLQGLSVGHGHGSYSARKTAPALFSACAWRYAAARSLALCPRSSSVYGICQALRMGSAKTGHVSRVAPCW